MANGKQPEDFDFTTEGGLAQRLGQMMGIDDARQYIREKLKRPREVQPEGMSSARLGAEPGGVLGGDFVREYQSSPKRRFEVARLEEGKARAGNVKNINRLIAEREEIAESKRIAEGTQAANISAGVERGVKETFDRVYAETGSLEKANAAAEEARAFFESSAAGTPVQLQRPVDDPVASGEAMQQALERKDAGLESLYGARISQLRGLGSQLEEQYAAERGSALAEQSVLARQTEDETDIRRAYREQEKARIETENVNRQIRAEAKEKAQLDIDEAVGEVVNFKIDPKRFYKGTGSAIASAIAVALGEFGSKLAGGPNTALSIINRAVDRDIDAQKTELQNLKYGASAAGNAYKRLLDRHGDSEKAERLAREQALTYVSMQLGEVADRYKVPLQASKLGQLISGIEKQRIANAMTLSDKEFESRIAAAKLRPAKVGGKMEQKDTEFFQDMAEFQSGIQEMRADFETIGGDNAKEALRWAFSGESKEKFFQELPSFISPKFANRVAQFAERGRTLSKTLSKMKEGGKISDMDLIFYMERMPKSTDNDSMVLYKMEVLETLARNALRMRTELTQGEFDKFNKRLQAQMSKSGVTSGSTFESDLIKKKLGIKD